ncbi:MAG: hypothetical protein V5A16_00405 [Haloplanus sp.]
MTDRSLDEFATPSRDTEAATTDANADDSVDPATPTMRWSAAATCDACGAAASRRWRDGDDYVCADCKEW